LFRQPRDHLGKYLILPGQALIHTGEDVDHLHRHLACYAEGVVAAGSGALPSTTWMPFTTPASAPPWAATCASPMKSAGRALGGIWSALVQAVRHCFTAHWRWRGLASSVTFLGRPRGSLCRSRAIMSPCSWVSGSSRKTTFRVALTVAGMGSSPL